VHTGIERAARRNRFSSDKPPDSQSHQETKGRPNEPMMPGKITAPPQIALGQSDSGDDGTEGGQGGDGQTVEAD
jgi:hypothetical protein